MNGLDPQDVARVTRYLQTLKRALGPLPQSDRTEIVAEIESHITERSSGTDASLTDILNGLGEPDTLARAYLDSRDLSGALSRSAPGPLLAAILARATRSAAAFAVGLAGVILYAFALSFALTAVLKPVMPRNVGFWAASGGVQFGFLSSPPAAPESLGFWIVPLALIAALLCYLAANDLMERVGRALLRRSTLPAPG